jgi:hypothetical protein
MDVGPYNHSVFPPAISLADADVHDVHDRPPCPDLEVVGADQTGALPRPPQHVEHLEQGD